MTSSITELLDSLRQGKPDAADDLFHHFMPRLRKKLEQRASKLRLSDADDIAVAAFYELCIAIENSRLEDISDRTQLWQVLSTIAIRKANDLKKFESAQKRGGDSKKIRFDEARYQVAGMDGHPHLQLELLEQCEVFLESLPNDELREVAQLKMRGMTNSEIGEKLGIATRTVQLMISRIKEKLSDSLL